MKIIGLIGEPAAGKSTVMRDFISHLGNNEVVKEGLVVYTTYPKDKIMVGGIYDKEVFSGTDRLSKGCGPKYRDWLNSKINDPEFKDWTFYWEGERFSNSKFFDFFMDLKTPVVTYYLKADPETLNARNAKRSNQNESWRKGMHTRMENLRKNYPVFEVEQGFSLLDVR